MSKASWDIAPSGVCKDVLAAAEECFRAQPLAFFENPEEEQERLGLLRREDPIRLQDCLNTSNAFVQAVRDKDLDELRRVVADAECGELLQVFVLQSWVIALKGTMLEIVRQMVTWGIPLDHELMGEALHLISEIVDRENFSDAWRILELLVTSESKGFLHVDRPRLADGWTPLCIASANACLPLAFKLLELEAEPNVVTRNNDTPLGLARRSLTDDTEEQKEARGIIANMLRHYGAQQEWKDALYAMKRPKAAEILARQQKEEALATSGVTAQAVSTTHTRYCG